MDQSPINTWFIQGHAQKVPRRAQEASKRPPRGSQRLPGGSKRLPRGAQEVPRGSHDGPRGPKRLPRGPQEVPKRPPRDPKRLPGWPQGSQKGGQSLEKSFPKRIVFFVAFSMRILIFFGIISSRLEPRKSCSRVHGSLIFRKSWYSPSTQIFNEKCVI